MSTIKSKTLDEKCRSLPELFVTWKKAHEEGNYRKTFPKNPFDGAEPSDDFKRSFTWDGCLEKGKTEAEVLFIGRESNVSDKSGKIIGCGEENDEFWMQKVYYNEVSGRNTSVYKNYLKKIASKLGVELKDCAYVNINKRGGYNKCSPERLEEYIEQYGHFIKREIEIINPKIIVFLGYGRYRYVEKLMSFIDENIKCYMVYHPSCPGRYKTLCEKLQENI